MYYCCVVDQPVGNYVKDSGFNTFPLHSFCFEGSKELKGYDRIKTDVILQCHDQA